MACSMSLNWLTSASAQMTCQKIILPVLHALLAAINLLLKGFYDF
jgi:hypothetical protein